MKGKGRIKWWEDNKKDVSSYCITFRNGEDAVI